jgi:biopolymer transport protein ExbD
VRNVLQLAGENEMPKRVVQTEHKVEQNMTAMIDVVFQLLTFFVMTFKVAALEGDFNLKMPRNAVHRDSVVNVEQPLKIHLMANAQGELTRFQIGSHEPMRSFSDMTRTIESILHSAASPGLTNETEVVLECDTHLKYNYVIEAITALSAKKLPNGTLLKLVNKISLSSSQNSNIH